MTKKTGLESPYILAGSSENFAALVLENSTLGPVLVNYWSPKAGPCLRLYPILDNLIHEFAGKMISMRMVWVAKVCSAYSTYRALTAR